MKLLMTAEKLQLRLSSNLCVIHAAHHQSRVTRVLVAESPCALLLTEADGGQETQAVLRREAGGEQRLQDVVGKRQRDHGLVGRVDHQHGDPQPQEPEQEHKRGGLQAVRNTEAGEKQRGVGRARRRKHITKARGTFTSFHLLNPIQSGLFQKLKVTGRASHSTLKCLCSCVSVVNCLEMSPWALGTVVGNTKTFRWKKQ